MDENTETTDYTVPNPSGYICSTTPAPMALGHGGRQGRKILSIRGGRLPQANCVFQAQ